MVSALDFQAGYLGFESRSGRDNFQTISTPSPNSTYPRLSIKWTEWCLVTDSGINCAWVFHESEAVQIHVYNNRRCLGCLVALKIRTTATFSVFLLWHSLYFESMIIHSFINFCSFKDIGSCIGSSIKHFSITKTRLFKYIENFNSKN